MNSISVIIPALNEELYIGETLKRLNLAIKELEGGKDSGVQVIVVDNDSTDKTADRARSLGATVIPEPVRNISRARNVGARAADGDVLLFLDADTLVPPNFLSRITEVMSAPVNLGGAVDILHQPKSSILRLYLNFYRVFGKMMGMAQGAAQFYRREDFLKRGGYDETILMGEDVEFYWRSKRAAKRSRRKMFFISDIQVIASPRRFDQWPLWKTLYYSSPLVIRLRWRRKSAWRGWYEDLPR